MTMTITNDDEKIKEVIKEYEEYAKRNGFSLNPNRKIAEVKKFGRLRLGTVKCSYVYVIIKLWKR